jgi:hypothetical protein
LNVDAEAVVAVLQHPLLRLPREQVDCICQWLESDFKKDGKVAWAGFIWILAARAATSALQRVWRQLWEATASRSGSDPSWTASEVVSLLRVVKLPPHEAAAVVLHARIFHLEGNGRIDWPSAMKNLSGSS